MAKYPRTSEVGNQSVHDSYVQTGTKKKCGVCVALCVHSRVLESLWTFGPATVKELFLVIIPFNSHFKFSSTNTRSHSLSLTTSSSTINAYRFSFFINSPFLWNSEPVEILKQFLFGWHFVDFCSANLIL